MIDVPMTYFNVEQCIYSLLTDPDFDKASNLIFYDDKDPTIPSDPDFETPIIDELVHGTR